MGSNNFKVTNIIKFLSIFIVQYIVLYFLVRITSLICSLEQLHDLTPLQRLSNYCILNNIVLVTI